MCTQASSKKHTHSTYVYKRKRIKSSLAPGLWHTLDVCFRARRRTWWDAIHGWAPLSHILGCSPLLVKMSRRSYLCRGLNFQFCITKPLPPRATWAPVRLKLLVAYNCVLTNSPSLFHSVHLRPIWREVNNVGFLDFRISEADVDKLPTFGV